MSEDFEKRLALIHAYLVACCGSIYPMGTGESMRASTRLAEKLGYPKPCEGMTLTDLLRPAWEELERWADK